MSFLIFFQQRFLKKKQESRTFTILLVSNFLEDVDMRLFLYLTLHCSAAAADRVYPKRGFKSNYGPRCD